MSLASELIGKGFIVGIALFLVSWFIYYGYIELKRKGIIDKIKEKYNKKKRRKQDGTEQPKQSTTEQSTETTTEQAKQPEQSTTPINTGTEGTGENNTSNAGDNEVAEQRSIQTGAVESAGRDSIGITRPEAREEVKENNDPEKRAV